jgi:hypothetical protein
LDGHVIAGEGDHPRTLRAVPDIERKRLDFLPSRAVSTVGIAAVRLAARLVMLIGRTAMDFSAHLALPHEVTTANAPTKHFGNRPLLSLRPESFPRHSRSDGGLPLRWSAIAEATEDAFQTVRRARSLCLRDSGGGCSFGVRHSQKLIASGDGDTLPRGLSGMPEDIGSLGGANALSQLRLTAASLEERRDGL